MAQSKKYKFIQFSIRREMMMMMMKIEGGRKIFSFFKIRLLNEMKIIFNNEIAVVVDGKGRQ
jgi:hypothetical protein